MQMHLWRRVGAGGEGARGGEERGRGVEGGGGEGEGKGRGGGFGGWKRNLFLFHLGCVLLLVLDLELG